MVTWISKNYRSIDFPDEMSFDDKVNLFEDRIVGWQLDIGKKTIDSVPHSAFGALSIVLSYFENIAKFANGYAGDDMAGHYFKEGVKFVYPDLKSLPKKQLDAILAKFYKAARCGLYHQGKTGKRFSITANISPAIKDIILPSGELYLQVNPHLIVDDLLVHFNSYIQSLRDPQNITLRANFEMRFEFENRQS